MHVTDGIFFVGHKSMIVNRVSHDLLHTSAASFAKWPNTPSSSPALA